MLEIKTKLPHLRIDALLRGDFIAEHKAQRQGVFWIAGRDRIDLAFYWPDLPLFVKRAYHDEAFIVDLAAAVERFTEDLDEMVERVRRNQGFDERAAA